MSMAFRPPQFQLKYLLPSEARRILMYSFFAKLVPQIFHTSFKFRSLCTAATFSANTCEVSQPPCRKKSAAKDSVRIKVKISDSQLKENWLTSMSCPFPDKSIGAGGMKSNAGSAWVIGIDPDLSGALAVIRNDDSGCSAQVFDSPYLQVPVGKRARRRLDAKSIVKLLRGLEAPLGTTAYIEQSIPYPQDGKQGWWSGGFGFGLWIGILVASGFSVIPVPSLLWKNEFELAGNHSGKDDSRKLASALFPSLSSVLQRKKDHGRAEALLIAAYGKKLKMKSDSSCILEKLVP